MSRAPEAAVTCPACGRETTQAVWRESLCVCPFCGSHQPIAARARLTALCDEGTLEEMNADLVGGNPLAFPGYEKKLEAQRGKTGMQEAVMTATGRIDGHLAVLAVLDAQFFMGSMGTGVGEKITRAIEYARDAHLPLIMFSASGGARMQEGFFSLMQMAKTSAAVADFSEKGGLYISVLTNPTTGGVTASFASLGDIMLAEPEALIGFAGPRVIEQTIGQRLPEGFQRSEFQQEHGFVDQIVPRARMRTVLSQLLRLHEGGVRRA
ncbi:MAG: acetyl-CoA carboxylase, carboxyltransferase subunit beta [Candidatus Ventricola sp.]